VPEKRADPQSRLIALPVTRILARSDHPGEPIFILQGGPSHTNMTFDKVSRYADEHEVVLVGYRGVDGSVRLDCPEVESATNLGRSATPERRLHHSKQLRQDGQGLPRPGGCAATLTVLSLLWMAWWVRKRGRFGTKASAALRSVYPIILGLGGFLLGTLIVLTTMPSIPIDNDLLVALAVGLSVGPWDLPGRGAPRLVDPEQGCWIRGGSRGRARRCLARVPCHHWPDSTGHRDPRSHCRRSST
jgi:hypothetical protein